MLQKEIDKFCKDIKNYYPSKKDYEIFTRQMVLKGYEKNKIEQAINFYERS